MISSTVETNQCKPCYCLKLDIMIYINFFRSLAKSPCTIGYHIENSVNNFSGFGMQLQSKQIGLCILPHGERLVLAKLFLMVMDNLWHSFAV